MATSCFFGGPEGRSLLIFAQQTNQVGTRLLRKNLRSPFAKQPFRLFCSLRSIPLDRGSKKARGCRWQPLAFLVDPRGVEPLSESPLIRLSPWAVCYLDFPICAVSRQTSRQSSHFVRDRFNGETPMHGHRSMTLGSRSRYSESNGQDRSLAALPN